MDKYIYDKSNGLWYELQGDYYIPCLTVSVEESKPIGLWGTAAQAASQGISPRPLQLPLARRQTEQLPCRHQRTGRGADAPADRADGRS